MIQVFSLQYREKARESRATWSGEALAGSFRRSYRSGNAGAYFDVQSRSSFRDQNSCEESGIHRGGNCNHGPGDRRHRHHVQRSERGAAAAGAVPGARPRMHFSLADYIDWRNHDRAFEQAAAFGSWGARLTLTGRGEPDQIPGVYATGSFFSILGVRPSAGRVFEAQDEEAGRTPTVVLSERLWNRKYGADPTVIGSTLNVNGRPHTVIGVAPASFRYPSRDTDIRAILPLDPPSRRGPYYLRGLGLLKPGIEPRRIRRHRDSASSPCRSGWWAMFGRCCFCCRQA